MSESSQGEGWWQASDGKWYPPSENATPGWWQASDGMWYPPQESTAGPPPAARSPRAWATKQVVVIAVASLAAGALLGALLTPSRDDETSDASQPVDREVDDEEDAFGNEPEEVVATTTTTTAPTTTTPPPESGTRERPVPRGQSFSPATGWTIRVTDFDSDAGPEVSAANQFNEPPVPGRVYVMATIEATYDGPEQRASAWLDMTFGALGPSNVAYGQDFDADYCGVIPNDLDETNDVFQGGIVTGNVCWAIEQADVSQLLMTVEDSLSFDGQLSFFELRR